MTETLADYLRIFIRCEQESRAAMSQIAKAKCCEQLRTFKDWLEVFLNDIEFN